jgi:phospholipid/cholesterol/gamma-HCH transport system substrate-binding protein
MQITKFILVGGLFFGALSVVGYFTIMTDGGPLKKELYSMKIYFPNGEGIKIGNKVTVQGVAFGYVSKVNLVQVDEAGNILSKGQEGIGTRVEVIITLPEPVKLYENYDIKIKNESLLSGRVIAIDPGTSLQKDPKTNEILPNARKNQIIDLSSTAPNSQKVKGKTNEDPLVSLSELIAENRADIRKTISNISDISGKINNGKGTLGRLINQDDIHSNVNTTLTDAQIVLRELREGLEDTREQAPVTSFIRAALSAF